ncbi:hypothetical protein BVC80_8861g24 [Macleaya cordata]|uniref:Uncharacterized protein n=1 Tax=Macleaya cordata TaxID=56857 RepID=A0A200Q5X2_MACCD|nr:hypothetical protein BVC80_8861g24 [Macleaya cordata]
MGQLLIGLYQSPDSSKGDKIHAYDLGMSVVWILLNLLFLEPRATKVMLEKMKWEKEEGTGAGDGGSTTGSKSTTIRTRVGEVTIEEVPSERQAAAEEQETERAERRGEDLEKLNQRLKKLNSLLIISTNSMMMILTKDEVDDDDR